MNKFQVEQNRRHALICDEENITNKVKVVVKIINEELLITEIKKINNTGVEELKKIINN